MFEAAGDVLQYERELGGVLLLAHGEDESSDGTAVHALSHSGSAIVSHRSIPPCRAAHVVQRGVHGLIWHVEPRIATGEQTHEHGTGNRGVRITGVRRVAPASEAIVFL